jgi:hypothetical protein
VSDGDVVIDDHLLLRVLLDDEPPDLRDRGGRISTTGLWYHRLGRALSTSTVTGSLSRALGDVEAGLGSRAVRAVTALPEAVGLTSLRELAWPMAQLLEQGVRLNLLSLEALATAEHLGAEICLATADENPPLLAAAAARGVRTRLVTP